MTARKPETQTKLEGEDLAAAEALKAGAAPDGSTTGDAPRDPAEVPTMAELNGVVYVGIADVKTLTAHDLASAGVADPKGDLTWSAENNFTIQADQINAATRDWLASQEDFLVQ